MKGQTYTLDQYNDANSTLTLSTAERKGLAKVIGPLPFALQHVLLLAGIANT